MPIRKLAHHQFFMGGILPIIFFLLNPFLFKCLLNFKGKEVPLGEHDCVISSLNLLLSFVNDLKVQSLRQGQ